MVQRVHDGARASFFSPRAARGERWLPADPPPHRPLPPPTRPQGTLRRKGETYDISWDAPAEVATAHNEAGRGCELSELVKFHDGLYTFDDRSGIMFQLMNFARSDSAEPPYLVPRHIFMEGPGDINDKGLKIEWATQKDGTLFVGSFGKEYTNNKGEVLHSNNLWAVAYKADGTATHVNWKGNYDAMRSTLGYAHPGYMIHETVVWSPHFRKWFVFPRRLSREAYDDVLDEKKGGNTIIMASHDFAEVTATTVGVRLFEGARLFLLLQTISPQPAISIHPLHAADAHPGAGFFLRKVSPRVPRQRCDCLEIRGKCKGGDAAHLYHRLR